MNKKLEKTLLEMFGEPLSADLGTKIGNVKDIKKIGSVGVRDESEGVCSVCGEMPVEESCGCDHTVDDDNTVCPGCGMMVVNGQCGCESSDVCPTCGQMPPTVDSSFSCGVTEGDDACSQCGMNETHCECDM